MPSHACFLNALPHTFYPERAAREDRRPLAGMFRVQFVPGKSSSGCHTAVFGTVRELLGSLFRRFRIFRIFRQTLLGKKVRKSILGRPGRSKRASGGVRGGSGRRLGRSWGCPGGSGGASWEGLGRSWGDLGATFKAVRCRIDLLIDFDCEKGAKREAFGEAKWTQNDAKSKSVFKSEKKVI